MSQQLGAQQLGALLQPLHTHDTSWDPSVVKVTLNAMLDGCIVPTTEGGARVDYSHLVVLDNFLDEPTRQGLMDALTQPGWRGPSPPGDKWERRTADAAARPATWGLKAAVLAGLAAGQLPAKLEVQSRLCKLYPDMLISHMPSNHIQLGLQESAATAAFSQASPSGLQDHHQQQQQQQQNHCHQHSRSETQQARPQQQQQPQDQQQQQHGQDGSHPKQASGSSITQQQDPDVDCSRLLANAAVAGDQFSWHVDADPACFPEPSPWTQQYGLYCNREAGKPLFVSLLLYLDKEWPRDQDAETLFLDSPTDTGVFVRPKAYRAVLMDQDVAHRLSTPSAIANRPRYSLVWKLVMVPKQQQQEEAEAVLSQAASIARSEWGQPSYFGSAAHVMRMAKQAAGSGEAVPQQAGGSAGAAGSIADAERPPAAKKMRHGSH